mgnify:CR=1 FL=1
MPPFDHLPLLHLARCLSLVFIRNFHPPHIVLLCVLIRSRRNYSEKIVSSNLRFKLCGYTTNNHFNLRRHLWSHMQHKRFYCKVSESVLLRQLLSISLLSQRPDFNLTSLPPDSTTITTYYCKLFNGKFPLETRLHTSKHDNAGHM